MGIIRKIRDKGGVIPAFFYMGWLKPALSFFKLTLKKR
jgi:hypothetical protein